ncbi:type II toxin-antitoxin system HipA family toxin [Hydrogenophaga sp.]|uniref:type II toxin-antitoxin system HipA family toxin n=1 Tax=Hydrogenophaga sp. TaxID=1904254 RepID=UPI0025BF81E0|nr:type II toxin-antitoxin system HipA family toxin [Hydrogenophaga sp.]
MGRATKARSLSVWANGERVGTWTIPARGDMEFIYDLSWIASEAGRPLSLSMPFTGTQALRGAPVHNYFENLLPDSEAIRKRLATRFKTDTLEAFDLLEAIGRDCVGAIQLLGADESPVNVASIEGTSLNEEQVEELLLLAAGSGAHPDVENDDNFRISLAGAQEKTALLWHGGQWIRPHGATPTSHILKLPIGLVGARKADFGTSVENEWLCMELMRELGLPTAKTEILKFGNQKVLSVERFDRQMHSSGTWLLRLPQEDFCQVSSTAPHRKYESDGGPGIAEIARVLTGSVNAQDDLKNFLKTQLIFWMMAAPDGHAKNFSLRILPRGRYALTPLYDVMSIWTVEGNGANQFSWHKAKLAMALQGKNRHYHFKDIQRRHFNATAKKFFQRDSAEDVIEEVLQGLEPAIAAVTARLPAGYPEKVATPIFAGLRRTAKLIANSAL